MADPIAAKRVILAGVFEPSGLEVPEQFMTDGAYFLERASLDKVRSAVAKWRNDHGDDAPEYWSKFKPFLASASGPKASKADSAPPAWWGRDGTWGGDWTTAAGWTMVIPAATMLHWARRFQEDSAKAFYRLAIENGARKRHIEAARYMLDHGQHPHVGLVKRWLADTSGEMVDQILAREQPALALEGNVTG